MKNKQKSILYITYLGMSEPIPQSQVLPYLLNLSDGFKIYLLSFEKKESFKNKGEAIEEISARLLSRGIKWIKLSYHKRPKVISSFFDIFMGMIISLFLIIKYDISIVHARSNIPIAIGYILKFILPIKLLYDRRGIMGEDHIEHSGWRRGGYLYRLSMWFEKRAIAKSDAIVVLTRRVNAQLRRGINSDRDILIETIPCCVDLQMFKYEDAQRLRDKLGLSGKFILVYSGSVGTYNLLNEMFDFFNEAREIIPEAHLLILTQSTDAVANLMNERQDIDKGKITVTYVLREEMPSFLSMGDVGLVFRRSSPTAIAASPTKFGEYLACGLPVVSTPQVGDLEEVINGNRIGVVLRGYEKSHYRESMNRLLPLLKEGDALRNRCRKVAEEIYSLERGARAYLVIYDKLMSG